MHVNMEEGKQRNQFRASLSCTGLHRGVEALWVPPRGEGSCGSPEPDPGTVDGYEAGGFSSRFLPSPVWGANTSALSIWRQGLWQPFEFSYGSRVDLGLEALRLLSDCMPSVRDWRRNGFSGRTPETTAKFFWHGIFRTATIYNTIIAPTISQAPSFGNFEYLAQFTPNFIHSMYIC